MADSRNSKSQNWVSNPSSSPPPEHPHKSSIELNNNNGSYNGSYPGQKTHYPNPPEKVNPDAATLRDQWRFAIRQYSKWYSHAWGTAILAGGAFFALGWIIKGGNPLPSKDKDHLKSDVTPTSPQIQGER